MVQRLFQLNEKNVEDIYMTQMEITYFLAIAEDNTVGIREAISVQSQ